MSATTMPPPATAVDPAYFPLSKRFRFGWIVELVVMGGLVITHDFLRNALMGTRADALRNAKGLTDVERWLGIYHERAVQQFFIDMGSVAIGSWNFVYETMHFLLPIVVAVYLYRKFAGRYVRMRNTFLIMLFITAPLCWWALPITPPKFMPERYGFVDTEVEYWNLQPRKPLTYGPDGEPSEESIELIGNIYGGMPSHHVSWSLWCVLGLWPVIKRRRLRPLLLIFPLLTLGAITVTGNHRFLDFAGSLVEVTIAYLLAIAFERGLARRRAGRGTSSSGIPAGTPSGTSAEPGAAPARDETELVT